MPSKPPPISDAQIKSLERADDPIYIDISHLVRDAATFRSKRKLRKGFHTILEQEGKKLKRLMQEYAPRKTGKLKDSIEVDKPEDKKNEFWVRVGPKVGYGKYLEYGTGKFNTLRPGKPYVIRAKPGKVLAFKAKDGRMVFAKQVIHPGIKAKPFIKPAIEDYADSLAKAAQEEIVRIFVNDPGKKPHTQMGKRRMKK